MHTSTASARGAPEHERERIASSLDPLAVGGLLSHLPDPGMVLLDSRRPGLVDRLLLQRRRTHAVGEHQGDQFRGVPAAGFFHLRVVLR